MVPYTIFGVKLVALQHDPRRIFGPLTINVLIESANYQYADKSLEDKQNLLASTAYYNDVNKRFRVGLFRNIIKAKKIYADISQQLSLPKSLKTTSGQGKNCALNFIELTNKYSSCGTVPFKGEN
jgi:hypothetical protein